MFCLYTFPAHNLNFHWRWRWRWWAQIQAIFLNLFYFKGSDQSHYQRCSYWRIEGGAKPSGISKISQPYSNQGGRLCPTDYWLPPGPRPPKSYLHLWLLLSYAWVRHNLTQIHFNLDVLCQLEKELLFELLFRNKLLKLKTCLGKKTFRGKLCDLLKLESFLLFN